MNSSKNITPLAFSLLVLALFYISCQKNPVSPIPGTSPDRVARTQHAAYVEKTISGPLWQIRSITVSPSLHNSTSVPIDTLEATYTYFFSPSTSHDEGSTSSINLGLIQTSDTNGKIISAPNEWYQIFVYAHTDSLFFHTNQYPTRTVSKFYFTIVRATKDSLVLKQQNAGYVYTRLYLPKK